MLSNGATMSSRVTRSGVMSPPAPSSPDGPTGWSIIVPVKQTTIGKSRLTGLSDEDRSALALAFALDTVTAALSTHGVRRVLVVTNDPDSASFVRAGAEVLADQPDAGLNAAIAHGAAHVTATDGTAGVAALTGDLPALTAAALVSVLTGATLARWFVPDSVGTGTTLLAARGVRLAPAFGPNSRAAHRASGAVEVDLPSLHPLRLDVDTESDLRYAVKLGVGTHTQAVLGRQQLRRLA